MTRIDAHIHFAGDTAEALALLDHFDLKLLNISFSQDAHGLWREQAEIYRSLADAFPDRYAWCTAFDLPRFEDPTYVQSVIEGLERDFAAGAVGCKVWKNLGMKVRLPSGQPFLVDDPLLEPIFSFVAEKGKSLVMHIADPLSAWEPLRDSSPHSAYFRAHPEWHMCGRADAPSHERLIESRDAVIARHPNLRVIGAHLASLEHDLDEVAWRLDRFPNLAVDTSARLPDLARHDRDKVREFCSRYRDRILFGTDHGINGRLSAMPVETRRREIRALADQFGEQSHFFTPTDDRATRGRWRIRSRLRSLADRFREQFQFFTASGDLTIGRRRASGLGLPADVANRILSTNARTWYPGL
jgi:predicted TIM-barrel fold metal-dependent hydrolase